MKDTLRPITTPSNTMAWWFAKRGVGVKAVGSVGAEQDIGMLRDKMVLSSRLHPPAVANRFQNPAAGSS